MTRKPIFALSCVVEVMMMKYGKPCSPLFEINPRGIKWKNGSKNRAATAMDACPGLEGRGNRAGKL
jgi:hypothetical protein